MAVSDAFNGTATTSSAATDETTTPAPATVSANVTFNVSTPGSGLVFDNTITGNYTGSTGTAFENDVISAEHILASQVTNSATINVELEAVNQGANGDGADNSFLLYPATYAQLKSALAVKEAGNPVGQIAARNLPATDPSNGVGFYLPTSYARFLGLTSASGGVEIVNGAYQFSASFPYDDAVILNTNYISDFGPDAIDAITHELSEGGLGRIGGLGDSTLGNGVAWWSTMDLFRYNSTGRLDDSDGRDGDATYFSFNGGQTLSASAGLFYNNQYNSQGQLVSPGDTADWGSGAAPDIFGAVSTVSGLSQTDDQILEALGWSPAVAASPAIVPTPTFDPSWALVGIGDYNGNGTADLAWEQAGGNSVALQLLQGTQTTYSGPITNTPFDSTWMLVGSGDFNGDGSSDLVYQQVSSGLTEIALLHGQTIIGGGTIANNPFGAGWKIVTTGDFTGNGDSDLVWQQPSSGVVEIQLLNGNAAVGGGTIANNPFAAGWQIVATGDFTGNGKDDLVWQNQSTGLVELQFLNGNTAVGGGAIANTPFGSGWSIVGAGDFLGNGFDDLVYQRQSDGLVEIQYLNGNTAVGGGAIANTPFGAGWQVVGVGDFNGDGKADLVYRNTVTGTTEVQFLNGITPIGGGVAAVG